MKFFKPYFILCLLTLTQCTNSADDLEITVSTETLTRSSFVSECDDTLDTEITTENNDDIITDSDSSILDCQIEVGSGDLDLDTNQSAFQFSISPSVSASAGEIQLNLLATIAAPVVDGDPLGATDTFFNGTLGLVTYNTAGSEYQGAVQVVDLTDPLNPNLLFQSVLVNQDVSAGAIDDDYLYLATGQSVDLTGNPTAAELQVATLDEDGLPDEFLDPLNLPSFVATSLTFVNDSIFVTTGNTGGVYKVTLDDLENIDSNVELEDARGITYNDDDGLIYVFQGTDGRVSSVDPESLEDTTYEVGGATIAEAKSTIEAYGGLLFAAAGDVGVLVIEPGTGEVIGTLDNPTSSDPNVVTSANAVSAYDDLLFVSNGEYGVRVVHWELGDDNEIDFEVIGTLTFGDGISANDITFVEDYLFVAAGVEGLKIIGITRSAYLQTVDCTNFPSASFCEEFPYEDGDQINDDVIWEGQDSSNRANAYAIDGGIRILKNKYIETLDEFDATTSGKQFTIKMYRSGLATVHSVNSAKYGVEIGYNGTDTVTAYIGKLDNQSQRIEIDFSFSSGQEFVIAHIYQEDTDFQVALEFSDGSTLISEVYSVSGSRMQDNRKVRLEPFTNADQSSAGPSFDDILVEDFSF